MWPELCYALRLHYIVWSQGARISTTIVGYAVSARWDVRRRCTFRCCINRIVEMISISDCLHAATMVQLGESTRQWNICYSHRRQGIVVRLTIVNCFRIFWSYPTSCTVPVFKYYIAIGAHVLWRHCCHMTGGSNIVATLTVIHIEYEI